MKRAINLADINQDGLLIVKNKNVWILPGGKPEKGESDLKCLYRELKEELSVRRRRVTIHTCYDVFVDKTLYPNEDLEAKVYFGSIKGSLDPKNEISDYAWVRKDNMDKYNLSFITKKIINSLIKVKYLK